MVGVVGAGQLARIEQQAVALIVTSDGGLVVNELALRRHNSGHAAIDACETSQFEHHLRAVLDWPLGSAAQQAPAAMVHLLSDDRTPPTSSWPPPEGPPAAAFGS